MRKTGFKTDTPLNREDLSIHEIYSALINDENRNDMIITIS